MSDDRLRLFVALELPAAVREALVTWRSAATEGVGALRLLSPESLHVTLCFLGGQAAAEVPGIAAAVGAAVPDAPGAAGSRRMGVAAADAAGSRSGVRAPELTVGEAIWLPRRRPRVLAVALHDAVPGGTLVALQDRLAKALAAGGWYRPEKRPFLGHVTVARVGREGLLRPPSLPEPPALRFFGERVTLFRSRLGSGGARYEALRSVALRGAG